MIQKKGFTTSHVYRRPGCYSNNPHDPSIRANGDLKTSLQGEEKVLQQTRKQVQSAFTLLHTAVNGRQVHGDIWQTSLMRIRIVAFPDDAVIPE